MIQIYFKLLQQVHLLKILLTTGIYLFVTPFNFFTFCFCDDIITESVNNNNMIAVNKSWYYGSMLLLGIFSLTAIYFVTIYYCPSYDYYDIFQNNLISELKIETNRLSASNDRLIDICGKSIVLNDTLNNKNIGLQTLLVNNKEVLDAAEKHVHTTRALLKSLAEPKQ